MCVEWGWGIMGKRDSPEHKSLTVQPKESDAQKKKAAVSKKKQDEGSPSESAKIGCSSSSSNQDLIVYLTCAIKGDMGQTILDCDNESSAAPTDRDSTADVNDQNSTVIGSDCPSIPHSERSCDKTPTSEKSLKALTSQEANGLLLAKSKTTCDVPSLPSTSATPDLESLLSDVSSDSSTIIARDSDVDCKTKGHERKRRHHSSEKRRPHHRHHRKHKRSVDSNLDDDSYDIPDSPLSIARAADDRIVHRIRKEFHHTDKEISSKQAAGLYFEALKDISSQHLKHIVDRSLRRISEFL